MNEMVERVARAICDKEVEIGAWDWEPDEIPEGENMPSWQFWISEASAAIAAMREPTEEMWKAGSLYPWELRGADDVWQAMIDEALRD